MSYLDNVMYFVADAISCLSDYKDGLGIGAEKTACESILTILNGLDQSSFEGSNRSTTHTQITSIVDIYHPVIATHAAWMDANYNFQNYSDDFINIRWYLLF